MFTGIIETIGEVLKVKERGTTRQFTVRSEITNELKVDQSVAHNGVCLTVTGIKGNDYTLDVVHESLNRSNLGEVREGDFLNIERSLTIDKRLDGHIVQGHVDATGICEKVEDVDGSWLFAFNYPEKYRHLMIDKGSITINGVSLTLIEPTNSTFRVTIIPYTYENTNFRDITEGTTVNLEFDVLAKYFARHMEIYTKKEQ